MTRTAAEIAADLVAAQQAVEWHKLRNVANKSAAELASMRAAWMEAERTLRRLREEERNFIEEQP
jgi:hypothetical protein